jgi:autotransporter-associated beta strand protein/T5SS/PEP-CTERM-associated repeat protein
MKTSRSIPRALLTTTAFQKSRWFACLIAGAGLFGSSSVFAVDWGGSGGGTDWNVGANWVGGIVPDNIFVRINIANPVATISSNLVATPTLIMIARGAFTGRLDHVAGTAATATDQDLQVALNGGNGTYNLANTAAGGGLLTGFGQGSGTMNVLRHLYVGGVTTAGASIGTVNIHTTGTLAIGSQLLVGNSLGTGTVNMDSGTVTVGDVIEIGNGSGSTGTLGMSGGSITKTGTTAVTIGGGATGGGTGTANLSGGTFTSSGVVRVANNAGSNGILNLAGGALTVNNEFWIGNNTGATGTLNFSSGSITQNNWAVIGRKDGGNAGAGGTGTVNMTGGTWTKTGDSNFIVGGSGPGTMTMSGGSVVVAPSTVADRGITWIGEQNNSTGVLTISGTADFRSTGFTIGVQPGTSGTLNLNGGTVRTSRILGGLGDSTVNFNGTQIIATGSSDIFIASMVNATVDAGGLLVDTAGFDVAVPQSLGGTGEIVKTGAGSLTLTGLNTYTGNHTVLAGKLAVSTDAAGIGDFSVANGAAMGLEQIFDSTLTVANVTLGSTGAAALDFDFGNAFGNPAVPALNVSGTLTLNGPVTINIADDEPALGSFPIVTYAVPKAGTGSFVLGDLPAGVSATLNDNGAGLVTLEITALSFPQWTGDIDGVWNTTTENWIDLENFSATTYADPAPVVFDDLASGVTDLTLNITVAPASVSFNNSSKPYSLNGSGRITGKTGLSKAGAADLTINTANDYTGGTALTGGTTHVNSIANSGSASSIGASSPAASNLVLAGGKLNYTGPATVSDRGFTINAVDTEITTASNLTLGGEVVSLSGNLIKSGAGNLTLSHNGPNVIGTVNQGLRVQQGTLTLSGAGAQTNTVAGEMWVANLPDSPADLVLNNTSLTTASWLALGRGNGDNGVCNLTATDSVIQTVNFSTGFNNGLANNASETYLTLHNTVWTNNGFTYLAESPGSTAGMTLSGNSQYNISNNFLLARFASTQATFTLSGTSSVTKSNGYAAIGNEGTAVMNVRDNASFTAPNNDFNIGDVGSSNGTLNLSDSGTVNVTNVFIGKNSGTVGRLNQTGGTFQSASYISIGRFSGGTGTVDISGGTLTSAAALLVGEEGRGTLTISGSATVTSNGDAVFVAYTSSGNGTLNLNGGTLVAKRLAEGAAGGISTVNFDGGLLKAATGANPSFVGGLNTAAILSGGAFIDTSGQNLTVSQNLGGSGGLTKSGTGTLTLSGVNTYAGATTVTGGTLAVSSAYFADTSAVTIAAGAVLALNHGLTDQVASLVIGNTVLGAGIYDAGTHPGVITGTGKIQVTGSASAYDTWIAGFPSIPVAERDPGADPDKDGSSNAVEFALGGAPDNGGSRPGIYGLIADSSADADSTKELLMTIAVRAGTPAFTGSPSPGATQNGFTYTIEGSSSLGSFSTVVTPVAPVVTGLPAAPAGYEYRTFSLGGSNGTPAKGFLRVKIGY